MNYNEFKNQIINSDITDWLYDDDLGKYIFINDIRISIIAYRGEEFDDSFYEEWVENYSDPNARRSRFFLQYNGNTIEVFYTASVDGGRNYIPYPNREGMIITDEQYRIGRIVNKLNIEVGYDFDFYLSQARITVI